MQDPQSTQHRLSARGHPGAHRLISSPPVKSAAGPVITYYTFTGAVGRQTPLLLKSVGPVWHLRWLRPAAPLPRRLWQLWRTRRPGGWAKRLFSLWSQKITCMDRNLRHLTLDIGVVRLRDIVSVGLPLRQSIYIYAQCCYKRSEMWSGAANHLHSCIVPFLPLALRCTSEGPP